MLVLSIKRDVDLDAWPYHDRESVCERERKGGGGAKSRLEKSVANITLSLRVERDSYMKTRQKKIMNLTILCELMYLMGLIKKKMHCL